MVSFGYQMLKRRRDGTYIVFGIDRVNRNSDKRNCLSVYCL